MQRKLNFAIIDEADSILIDEAQTPMIIAERKRINDESNIRKVNEFVSKLKGIEIIREQPKNKKQQRECEKFDYIIDKTYKTVELTEKGIKKAEEEYKVNNLYEEQNKSLILEIKQALRANYILKKDRDYIVKDKKIYIIDKFTGRIMYGKRFRKGLHEAIEAKEKLRINDSSEILATITTQNYFKMYRKIAGMTGTAKESEKEFNQIYQLDVVTIPTNRKIQRKDKKDRIFATKEEKYTAIVKEIKKCNQKGQPVLIGTTSIETSEKVSDLLKEKGIQHYILNAKNHEEEANIIKRAGESGKITVATNMAGRGTNIVLGNGKEELEKVVEAGGLKVIGTERHEDKRIDEQLRGRSGRQGQIGESIFYISLEDEILKIYANNNRLKKYAERKNVEGEITRRKIREEINRAQKRAENRSYSTRKRLVYYDGVLNKQRSLIYKERKKVLEGNIEKILENFLSYFCQTVAVGEDSRIQRIRKRLEQLENIKINSDTIEELKERIKKKIKQKEKMIEGNLWDIEKKKVISVIDQNWIEHLENMEDLKDNVELRIYGGYNPIWEYEKEGRNMFDMQINKIKMDVICQLLFAINYCEI